MATDTTRDLLATLSTNAAAIACSRRVVSTRRGSSQMRNVLRDGMLGADVGDTDVRSLSSLAECVVTRVKVFALLQFVLQEVFLGGHLAIEAEKPLLIRAHFASIDLVLLMGIHVGEPEL